ncbi:GntR family transcriptional regulator [Streptomyces sp. NBC_01465]|uniref:GntR family transcriptional regulator n=1 Tax=Streptomyces sp. NBC_01465 TaxID=2903878 RepID=UPI002E2F570B|nr:GntR family transcriptional regulator [Streptomyces sp. NBC_01465]
MGAGQGEAGGRKYQRIADELKTAISAGEYGPGDRLPGENDLMAVHGVARMTVRQALAVLQGEGIAEARKGAGVFVRGFRPLRRRGIQRLAAEQWGAGRSVWSADVGEERELVVDQVSVAEEPVDARIAHVLGVEAGALVWVRRRRYALDGKPVMLAASHLPAGLVAGSAVTRPDPGSGGIYARLAELGHAPVHFREELRSRMPTPAEAKDLELPSGTPVILVSRTAFAAGGGAVEANEMVLDSASYILEYDFEA